MELAFASLHQLCGAAARSARALPAPQRRRARDRVRAERRRRRRIGSSSASRCSSLVSEAAERASAAVRRRRRAVAGSDLGADARVRRPPPAGGAGGDRVRRARAGRGAPSTCPSSRCAASRNGDARALLSSAVRFQLDERVRDRIIAETRGNPLALLELPRGLTADGAGGRLRAAERAATSRNGSRQSYVRRLEPLPDDARRLLLRRGGRAGRRSAAAAGARASSSGSRRRPPVDVDATGCWRSASA